jgi:hypothetical protein
MVALIRPIERAAKARGEDYLIREVVLSARWILVRAHEAVVMELAAVAGPALRLPDE